LIGTFDGASQKTTINLNKMCKVNGHLLNTLKSMIFNGLYFYLRRKTNGKIQRLGLEQCCKALIAVDMLVILHI